MGNEKSTWSDLGTEEFMFLCSPQSDCLSNIAYKYHSDTQAPN